jgi:hypothetical protein
VTGVTLKCGVDGTIRARVIVECTTAHSGFLSILKMCSNCKYKSVELGTDVKLEGFKCVENFWYILNSSSGS